jgi:hypothetical protein
VNSPESRRSWFWPAALLAVIFLFRLAFGFFANMSQEDQRQTYLIGLKYFSTGLWPYFGPDVIEEARPDFPHIQIPGALEGLAIGLPLRLWPVPESPFVFVNLLSFASLCLFAWYCSRRLPEFPLWILWGWLFTAPWVLTLSTNMDNASYLLFGGVLFFVGFLETVPALTAGILPSGLANLMMGFAFFWNAQFHMSFVLQVPFLIVSAYCQLRLRKLLHALAFLLFGAAASGVFILPTFLRFGIEGFGGTGATVTFHFSNFTSFFTILARFFSLACAEVPRFIGRNTAQRMLFIKEELWTAPFTVVMLVLGIAQPTVMLLSGLRRTHPQKDWRAVKILSFATFLLIYGSFLFAVKLPASYTFYITLPVAMLYMFYTFSPWCTQGWFKTVAAILLVSNLVFHLGMAAYNYDERSLFTYRGSIVKAIENRDYHEMGERRKGARY